tara:strand:+ start:185 stop:412 length:228 start_codon:yes stop_codon:yes gene_type:complete
MAKDKLGKMFNKMRNESSPSRYNLRRAAKYLGTATIAASIAGGLYLAFNDSDASEVQKNETPQRHSINATPRPNQ